MTRRPHASLTDYLLIALNPALIIGMVGSSAFFLLQLFYRGDYADRLWFICGLFVMATVLIARISIEDGRHHAALFALPLAVVTAFAAGQLANLGVVGASVVLGGIWWWADRLTYDCTLPDQAPDMSGAGLLGSGLLGSLGWDDARGPGRGAGESPTAAGSAARSDARSENLTPERSEQRTDGSNGVGASSIWGRWLPRRRRRAPGVWVVYFSLAALPFYGAGQRLLPPDDPTARSLAFGLLVVHLGCALALLTTTNFLALRHYMRRRGVDMSLEMTVTWLAAGALLIAATLAFGMLLPRPGVAVTRPADLAVVDSPTRDASRWGWGSQAADGRQQGRAVGSSPSPSRDVSTADRESSVEPSHASKAPKTPQTPERKNGAPTGDGTAGDQDAKQESRQVSQPTSDANRPAPSPEQPSASVFFDTLGEWLSTLLRLASYLLLAGLLAWGAWRNRDSLIRTLRELRDEWRRFWARLFARRQRQDAAPAQEVSPNSQLPAFASFPDPFGAGRLGEFSASQLVVYSFQALEAWAREQKCPRQAEQTPLEFAQAVAARRAEVGREACHLAELYGLVAYAGRTPPAESVEKIRRLWRRLGEPVTTSDGEPIATKSPSKERNLPS